MVIISFCAFCSLHDGCLWSQIWNYSRTPVCSVPVHISVFVFKRAPCTGRDSMYLYIYTSVCKKKTVNSVDNFHFIDEMNWYWPLGNRRWARCTHGCVTVATICVREWLFEPIGNNSDMDKTFIYMIAQAMARWVTQRGNSLTMLIGSCANVQFNEFEWWKRICHSLHTIKNILYSNSLNHWEDLCLVMWTMCAREWVVVGPYLWIEWPVCNWKKNCLFVLFGRQTVSFRFTVGTAVAFASCRWN